MDTTSNLSYRSFIESEFAARKRRNPAYSMRAYAKSLGVSAATISEVLSGSRHINMKSALTIVENLQLPPRQRAKFLVSAVGAEVAAAHIQNTENAPEALDADRFSLIADWYHLAILSLLDLRASQWSAPWLAEQLQIPEATAEEAMQRLLRLGLVEIEEGSFRKPGSMIVQSSRPREAIQSYHRQNLQKALHSLKADPMEDRDISSVTMAVDPGKLETARKLINKFREDMQELLDSGEGNERVYTMSVCLFPVSQKAGDPL